MKTLLRVMCVLTGSTLISVFAVAQPYPSKAIRFIVPYPAGGAVDTLARATGQKLTEAWKQAVVIDNRSGAGGMIGTEMIAKAPPDGYTVGLAHAGPLAINPWLYKSLPYSPATDFSFITLMGRQQNMLVVHPSLPVKSVKELIALAKGKPNQIAVGSGGSGTGSHLASEMFISMTGIRLLHVPYKGNAPSVIALLSGEVQMMFPTILTVKPHIEAGKLRALAVTTDKRVPALPDIPTVAEAGVPEYESSIWFGVMGPSGMSREVIGRINVEMLRILNVPDFKSGFAGQGLEIETCSADQFAKLVRDEGDKWAKVIKAAGIKAQ